MCIRDRRQARDLQNTAQPTSALHERRTPCDWFFIVCNGRFAVADPCAAAVTYDEEPVEGEKRQLQDHADQLTRQLLADKRFWWQFLYRVIDALG